MTETKQRKIPMRRCVGCMESKPKKELIRLVADGSDVKIDASGKANGRGIYLCANGDCFDRAKKRKSITRGLGIAAGDADWYENLKLRFAAAQPNEEVSK